MHEITYEATVINGQISLPAGVELPDNAKVLVIIPNELQERAGRLRSPRLAHPEQAADFSMDVQEIADAGV
jgi:hypothetical protein